MTATATTDLVSLAGFRDEVRPAVSPGRVPPASGSSSVGESATDGLSSVREAMPVADPRGEDGLIEDHLSLADNLARGMTPRGQSQEDFVQVARLGLVEAGRRFDPARGVPFAGYAAVVITGYLKHHLRDRCWSVRPPRRIQELWLQALPARERLGQKLGRSPTPAELAAELDVSGALLTEAFGAEGAWSAESFEQLTAVRERPWEPAVQETRYELIEDRSWLHPALRSLPPRLRGIVEMRFVEELTQREIAERVGCSQMHVSRLLSKALAQLRSRAEAA